MEIAYPGLGNGLPVTVLAIGTRYNLLTASALSPLTERTFLDGIVAEGAPFLVGYVEGVHQSEKRQRPASFLKFGVPVHDEVNGFGGLRLVH